MKTDTKGRTGAVLVIVAISMVAAAAAGLAILSVSTSSRYERVGLNSSSRAYFMAESGAEFVRSCDPEIRTTLSGTYTNASGDQFIISVATNAQGWVVVRSIGIANPGTALESRQQVHFEFADRGVTPDQPRDIDFYNEDGSFNSDAWGIGGGSLTPTPMNTGPSGGEGALDIQGTAGYLYLTWHENTNTLDKESRALCRAWEKQANSLGYDVQMKIQPYENPGVGFGKYHMLGISFRLRENGAGYGLSFFRAATANPTPALPWIDQLSADWSALRGTNSYVVLWQRASSNDTFQLIASRLLTTNDAILKLFNEGTANAAFGITNYSTLLLQLKEERVGTNLQNRIAAFVQSPVVYPSWPNNSGTNALWPTNAPFQTPLAWDNGASDVVHSAFSSETNYCSFASVTNAEGVVEEVYAGPPEIGIHVFYDSGGANKKFFDDFAVKIQGSGTPYGGSQIQY
jgi:hypothetical protein